MLMFNKKVSVKDQAQADGVLAEMAAIDRKLSSINVKMNESIATIKAEASKESAHLVDRRKALNNALKKWANLNKPTLFAKKRSIDLAFGSIGFKRSQAIQQMKGVDAMETLTLLQRFNYDDGIRTVLEINKDAMAMWPDDKLTTVGLCRVKKDTFFCDPAQEKVATTK